MEQQRRQRAVATFGVVFQGHVHRRQQQLPQQRRHRQHLAVRRHRHGAAGLDVQAAGAHPEHSHLVLDARRNPHCALWRHHPAGVAGTHLHHPAGTVQQLRATMPMARQQVAVGIVGTHGHHGPGVASYCSMEALRMVEAPGRNANSIGQPREAGQPRTPAGLPLSPGNPPCSISCSFCGCLTGVSAVLFGFGGGFVVVPLLYHLLQLGRAADDPLAQAAMQVAVATSTCVMIVNAALATYRHRRAGSLLRAYVWPLGAYIGVGAVLGAALVGSGQRRLHSPGLRRLPRHHHPRLPVASRLPQPRRGAPGAAAGRRRDAPGRNADRCDRHLPRRRRQRDDRTTAAPLRAEHDPGDLHGQPAEPAGGSWRHLTYLVLAGYQEQGLGRGFVGYIDLLAFATLAGGGWLGIRLATPLIGRIPDALHARVYVGLLAAVMLSMLAG